MSTTLTIRNLAAPIKQRLRLQAAIHNCSMEAEARKILAAALSESSDAKPRIGGPRTAAQMKLRLQSITGVWKSRTGEKSTDNVMRELRGED